MDSLTAFDGASKPIMTHGMKLETSSNSLAVQRAFTQNQATYNLDFESCVLFMSEGASYIAAALVDIRCLCPCMSVIFCPCHAFSNGCAELLDDDNCCGKQIKQVFTEGTKLFKNSTARKTDFRNYFKDQNILKSDPLIRDLIEAVDEAEFRELYSLPGNVDVTELKEQLNDAEDVSEQQKSDDKLKYLNKTVNVKNKWKTIIFCSFW